MSSLIDTALLLENSRVISGIIQDLKPEIPCVQRMADNRFATQRRHVGEHARRVALGSGPSMGGPL